MSDMLWDEFWFVIETKCDSLNREPSDEALAIENSHQHNGTKSRATRRQAVSPVSSTHTRVILQPLDYKGKIAEQMIKASNEEHYGTDKPIEK